MLLGLRNARGSRRSYLNLARNLDNAGEFSLFDDIERQTTTARIA